MRILFFILTFIVLLQSCRPTKFVPEGKHLLNNVKLKNNNHFTAYDLEEFYHQTPNRKFFLYPIRPYLYAYYYGEKVFDSTRVDKKFARKYNKIDSKILNHQEDSLKILKYLKKKNDIKDKHNLVLKEGNWLMRSVGESVILYDSTLGKETAREMKKYMRSHGYLHADAVVIEKYKRKKVNITFKVYEKKPFIISKIAIECEDEKIKKIIENSHKNALVKIGDIYQEDELSNERERITNLLKSNGYFNFVRQNIHFEIDTTIKPLSANMKIVVTHQHGSEKIYSVSDVLFITDVGVKSGNPIKDTTFYNGVKYVYSEKIVSEKILNKKMLLKANDLYSLNNTLTTQKNLADLGLFKFVNINYYPLSDSSNQILAIISTSPFQKYQFNTEFGINVFQGLPGPFGNFNFRTRNLFGGAEILDITVRTGIEGQSSITNPGIVLSSQEFGANAVLTFQYFLQPFKKLESNNYNPKTQFKTGISMVDRPEFIRNNFTSSFNYVWQKNKNTRSAFTPLQLSIINTKNESTIFKAYLESLRKQGNNLYLSFRPSIVSSMSYDFIYDNNLAKLKKRSQHFHLNLESGGTTLNFIKTKVLEGEPKLFGLDYFRYLRAMTDYRYYIPTKNKNIIATRAAVGIAKSLGGTNVLPYEKYFFSGGSYSNRAWLPRRLGPGDHTPLILGTDIVDETYRFEQPGELMFEANIEYRFRIKGVLDGALFTDVGNVWMLKEDSREGSDFNLHDFYTEIAVGSGFGFRFDFSFLILRLDIGSKIWDPAQEYNERFIPSQKSLGEMLFDKRITVVNLGIGYPF